MVPPKDKRKSRTRNPPKMTTELALEQMRNRKLHPEKQFPSTPENHPFLVVCAQKGYTPLLRKRFSHNEPIVRAFYATTKANGYPSISFRGKNLDFDVDKIAQYLQNPKVDFCQYQAYLDDPDSIPWPEILESLTNPGANWTTRGAKELLERKDMNDLARVWLNFMCSTVKPKAHMFSISKEEALLLYCLMRADYPVNIAEIAFKAIESCAQSETANLVFPHLISEMCVREKVPTDKKDTKFNVVRARSFSTMTATPAVPKKRQRLETEEPDVEEPAMEAGFGAKLDQIMARLEEVQLAQLEERGRRILMEQMMARIADRFDVPFIPGFPFTEGPGQASGTKAQEEEEEKEEEEGEEEGGQEEEEEEEHSQSEEEPSSYDESSADSGAEFRTKTKQDKPTD